LFVCFKNEKWKQKGNDERKERNDQQHYLIFIVVESILMFPGLFLLSCLQ